MPFASSPVNQLPVTIAGAVNRFLGIDRLRELVESVRPDRFFPADLLRELEIHIEVSAADTGRVPKSGPAIVVSNHPFGLLDGALLASFFIRVRPDVRILTNRMLREVEGLKNLCFFLDPLDRPELRAANAFALKQSIAHVRRGGMLVMFPAGEVSHFDLRAGVVRDPEWRKTAARLVRITKAPVLPVRISGANGIPFQLLGIVHPFLRTAALPSEFLNKRGKTVEVRVGSLVSASVICAIDSEDVAVGYLRTRTELLAHRTASKPAELNHHQPLNSPVPPQDMAKELAALPALCLLEAMQELAVYVAEAPMIPHTLLEIGRLREATFRAVGEGTGAPHDLDRFDPHYLHLFIWNKEKQEVVGAYRMGDVPRLLARFGPRGLYTETLFHFSPEYFRDLGPALELGRSFIRVEYQKRFQPLLLLWRGITAYIARRPEYATLIGAVSISSRYSPASRELIASCFTSNSFASGQRSHVRPRNPLLRTTLHRWELDAVRAMLTDPELLAAPVQDMEQDGKSVPVLLRQYVRLGGRILAFSVDPDFGNTLDGFVTLDLRHAPADRLTRYMGRERTKAFLDWHKRVA